MFRRPHRELMYVPLTERDEAIREDVRYRVGHWLAADWDRLTTIAVLMVGGLPAALVADWLSGESFEDTGNVYIAVLVLWLVCAALLYARWFEYRQYRSERRRGYRFFVSPKETDVEIATAKQTLLSMTSTESDREQALEFLISRGACSPPGHPPPKPPS